MGSHDEKAVIRTLFRGSTPGGFPDNAGTMTHPIRLLAVSLLCAWGVACAQDTPPAADDSAPSALRLSGFGTLGAVYSDASHGWTFRREFTQPFNDGGLQARVDTRLGLQANYTFNERLEAVAQLVLKDRLRQHAHNDSLEAAFLSYHIGHDTTVRLGRIGAGIYMLADQRNIGFAYASVRPNADFYGALPVYWADGADIRHSWDAGDVRWTLRSMAGTHAQSDIDTGGGQPPTRIKAGPLGVIALTRVQGGLRLQAQAGRMRLYPGSSAESRQARQGLAAVEALWIPTISDEAAGLGALAEPNRPNLNFLSVGMEYEQGAWVVTAEAARINGEYRSQSGLYGYATAARRFGDTTVFGTVSRAQASEASIPVPQWEAALTPTVGAAAAAQYQQLGAGLVQGLNRLTQRQTSAGLGMRFDLDERLALKVQWDHYWVRPYGSGMWSNATTDRGHANVGTVTLDFVF